MTRGHGLSGRRVLITGASSGVGSAAARRFSEEGASVALLARRGDQLQSLADELGRDAHPLAVDITDPSGVAATVATFATGSVFALDAGTTAF